jgi:hypothetical protein
VYAPKTLPDFVATSTATSPRLICRGQVLDHHFAMWPTRPSAATSIHSSGYRYSEVPHDIRNTFWVIFGGIFAQPTRRVQSPEDLDWGGVASSSALGSRPDYRYGKKRANAERPAAL